MKNISDRAKPYCFETKKVKDEFILKFLSGNSFRVSLNTKHLYIFDNCRFRIENILYVMGVYYDTPRFELEIRLYNKNNHFASYFSFKRKNIIMAMNCRRERIFEPLVDFLIENDSGFVKKIKYFEKFNVNEERLKVAKRYYHIGRLEKVEYFKTYIKIFCKKGTYVIHFYKDMAVNWEKSMKLQEIS